MLERILGEYEVLTMLRSSKSPKPGTKTLFCQRWSRKEGQKQRSRAVREFFLLQFTEPVLDVLEKFGKVPLPPYITHAASKSDESRYQTVCAKEPGAVAAPTAGLHFTDELLKDIKALGCEEVFVTLHVGAGTFQPVRSEKLSEHKMHSEWYHIDQKQQMPSTKHLRKEEEWFCVGTTSLRAVESAAALEEDNQVKSWNTRNPPLY